LLRFLRLKDRRLPGHREVVNIKALIRVRADIEIESMVARLTVAEQTAGFPCAIPTGFHGKPLPADFIKTNSGAANQSLVTVALGAILHFGFRT
jgi:hypothetical protein